jgi:TPR repeat protein
LSSKVTFCALVARCSAFALFVLAAITHPRKPRVRPDEFAQLQAAAERGELPAQHDLGAYYLLGIGVAKNEARAVDWFRRAAEKGHAPSQWQLGRCYAEGLVIEKDQSQAVSWRRKGAEQGSAESQNCRTGHEGIPTS